MIIKFKILKQNARVVLKVIIMMAMTRKLQGKDLTKLIHPTLL